MGILASLKNQVENHSIIKKRYWFINFLVSFVSPSLTVYEPPEASSVRRPPVVWALQYQEREGNVGSGRKWKSFFLVCAKMFWRAIYCANPRPEPYYQSGSLSHRVLVRQDPLIIHEYYLATAIVIQPLTQPRTCKIGSSIFSATRKPEFASTTRVSFPIMPSTERKNGETCFRCSWQWLTLLSLFYFSSDPGVFPMAHSWGCRSLGPPVWRQWWLQSDFNTIHVWGRRISSIIRPSPGVPPPLIYCIPGGVFRKFLWKLVSRDGNFCHFWGLILGNVKRLQFHWN